VLQHSKFIKKPEVGAFGGISISERLLIKNSKYHKQFYPLSTMSRNFNLT